MLDLDTRAGLAIARSLGRGGLAVAVAAREGDASGLKTRYASTRFVLPSPERDFEAYAQGVLEAVRAVPAEAIIPSTDWSVEALVSLREKLQGLARPALGAPEAVTVASSKERTLAVATRLGMPVPRSTFAASPAEVRDAVAEFGLPVVVKALTSWRPVDGGGERVGPVYLGSAEDLAAVDETVVRADAPALVQEFASGVRETVKLFRDRGRFVATLLMRVERTWPLLGGSSVMRTTIPVDPVLVESAQRLVSEIGLDGYSEVEFRRTHDGRPLLMEVNPRLSQSVELAVRAGVDFPRMQFDWARGGTVKVVDGYHVGARLGWLAGDLRVAAFSPTRRAALAEASRDYVLRRSALDGFDPRDLRPSLGALAFTLRSGARRA